MGSGKGGGAPTPPAITYPAGFNVEEPREGEGVINQADFGSFGQFSDSLHQFRYQDWLKSQQPEMPDFGSFFEGFGSSEDYAAQLAQQQADQERIIGENDRDSLFSDYMSAADSATSYINNQITQQQANADLLGIQYNVDDEQKGTMISDYFASIWGAGDQSRLEGLMGKWGNPKGFSEFAITRGDASSFGGPEGAEKTVETSKGVRPTLATDVEEDTLDQTSILGG